VDNRRFTSQGNAGIETAKTIENVELIIESTLNTGEFLLKSWPIYRSLLGPCFLAPELEDLLRRHGGAGRCTGWGKLWLSGAFYVLQRSIFVQSDSCAVIGWEKAEGRERRKCEWRLKHK